MPSTSSSSQASTKNQSKDSVKKSPFGVTDDNESIIYGSSPVPKLVSTTKNGEVNLGSKSYHICYRKVGNHPFQGNKLILYVHASSQ